MNNYRITHRTGMVIYVNGTTYATARRTARSIFRAAGLRALDSDMK